MFKAPFHRSDVLDKPRTGPDYRIGLAKILRPALTRCVAQIINVSDLSRTDAPKQVYASQGNLRRKNARTPSPSKPLSLVSFPQKTPVQQYRLEHLSTLSLHVLLIVLGHHSSQPLREASPLYRATLMSRKFYPTSIRILKSSKSIVTFSLPRRAKRTSRVTLDIARP